MCVGGGRAYMFLVVLGRADDVDVGGETEPNRFGTVQSGSTRKKERLAWLGLVKGGERAPSCTMPLPPSRRLRLHAVLSTTPRSLHGTIQYTCWGCPEASTAPRLTTHHIIPKKRCLIRLKNPARIAPTACETKAYSSTSATGRPLARGTRHRNGSRQKRKFEL